MLIINKIYMRILILLVLLFFTSCSINNDKDNKISILDQENKELRQENTTLLLWIDEQNNKDQIFENNLKCISNKEEATNYVDKYLEMTSLDKGNLKWDSMIFYSPKTNSCLFTIWTVLDDNDNDNLYYSFRIFEYWTENEIVMKNYSCDFSWAWGFTCAKKESDNMLAIVESYR